MIKKKVCIEGRWLDLCFYKEEDDIKIEVKEQVLGKHHKVFPDAKIKNKEF